jgi:hypothetical protein
MRRGLSAVELLTMTNFSVSGSISFVHQQQISTWGMILSSFGVTTPYDSRSSVPFGAFPSPGRYLRKDCIGSAVKNSQFISLDADLNRRG